jgi:HSP20 family protein
MNIKELIPWSRGRREVSMRRDDADPIVVLQADINRVFDNFWRGFDPSTPAMWDTGFTNGSTPPIDLRETEKEIEVVAELPGMDEKDVEVSVADGTLVIR